MKSKIAFILLFVLLVTTIVAAHSDLDDEDSNFVLFVKRAEQAVYGTSLLMIIVSLFSILWRKTISETQKKILFLILTVSVILTTFVLVGSTLYLNFVSPTKGPVHWHADFEIILCGKNVELQDPSGIMNRIGESDLHEHNDMRIHVEGTPASFEAIELSSFFRAVGGEFTESRLVVPTTGGMVGVGNGDVCNGKPGTLLLFVEKQVGQERIWMLEPSMGEYIISGYGTVPPGDRLLITFTSENPETILAELQEEHG